MPNTAHMPTDFVDNPRLNWLEPVAETIQEQAQTLFGLTPAGPRLKSLLNGTPFRHRLHPMIVDVPVGAWTTSMFLDTLALASSGRQRRQFETGAKAAIALGIAGTLPAVWTGLADWVDTRGTLRRHGTAHALLNSLALGCYSVSLAARRDGSRRHRLALASAGLGFSVLTVSAAIGGDMVYNRGVNIPAPPEAEPPGDYVDVMASSELVAGQPRHVEAGELPVLLVRDEDGVAHALQHWCPHAGGPLSEGEVEDGVVTCPWHGSQFHVEDGRPVRGPAATPLPVYGVHEQAGRILIGPAR
jgi:nitrite reductase/ring-hydroxylating ferredoxin subunit/uncharacterized membrane protein